MKRIWNTVLNIAEKICHRLHNFCMPVRVLNNSWEKTSKAGKNWHFLPAFFHRTSPKIYCLCFVLATFCYLVILNDRTRIRLRIRFRIKVKGRIRIRIKGKGRIRIRIKAERWIWIRKKISHLSEKKNLDPHQSERSDPDPHKRERSDPDPHKRERSDPDQHPSEKVHSDAQKPKGGSGSALRWRGSATQLSSVQYSKVPCTRILEQSMGARKRVRIGLSYRPARIHRLAESIPWNWFLGSLKV